MAARKALERMAIHVDIEPQQALLAMVSEAAGNVAWLGARVAELSVEADAVEGQQRGGNMGYKRGGGLFGPTIIVDKDGDEHVSGEEYRAMTKLYNEWSDKLVKYAKAAIDAGIAKQYVELAQAQGQTIVVVLNKVLVQLGIKDEQLALARKLIAEEFRALPELAEVSRE
jgi:hypothetical protein